MNPLRYLLIVAVSVAAQPAFEVASIKPTPPERRNQLRLDDCLSDGSYSVAGIPVFWSLKYAFGLRDYQILGAPRWATEFDSAYDIEARPSAPVSSNNQCREMLQALFAERFGLIVHRETKEQPVLLLTQDPRGRKVSVGGGVRLNGSIQTRDGVPEYPDGWTMSQLAAYLSEIIERPVLDRTELPGRFAITLDFSRIDGADKPTIFTAVREQLGLNLESAKAPVETLIIDNIQRPSGNE
ncbi:MAG: TIGR03435 family protein [Bryobacteraceae bacterium]